MKVIWSQEAANDLENIVTFIAQDSPEAAARLASHIFTTIMGLSAFPFRGRKRKEDSGREIVFVPWPYVCVYAVVGEAIHVKAIRHTSRDDRDVSYFT
jgi:toxin ParE1/3/4